jgi:aminoglycoside phosphotransferase
VPASPPPPPQLSAESYSRLLGDVEFWAPYVRTILERHGLGDRPLESGFVGTFPTFLAGDVVVKLFGHFHSWRTCHASELAAQQVLARRPGLAVPALLGHGRLYGNPDGWPYLLTARMAGQAWRDAPLDQAVRVRVAGELGETMRVVHDVLRGDGAGCPPALVAARDRLAGLRATTLERHRAWGSLPTALVDQIPGYLCPPAQERFVHADLTADHVFVKDGSLAGVIDWGDATLADPYYELAALHLDAFRLDKDLLRAFLRGYGWQLGEEFTRRAMSAALTHEFDVFAALPERLRADSFPDLSELAAVLWDVAG